MKIVKQNAPARRGFLDLGDDRNGCRAQRLGERPRTRFPLMRLLLERCRTSP